MNATQNDISSALLDAYDIRNAIPEHIKRKPKDNDGTDTTIGDCLDAIIELLEQLEGGKQMTLTKQQLHTTAVNYLPRMGGFATKLAAAYLHADGDNQKKIEGAFMHLFERAYRMWHEEKENA